MDFVATHELISRIRDHINHEGKRKALINEREKWSQLTSSLDVLADSVNAIEFYFSSEYPNELGGKYLFIYGLLQCIFLAQDAAYGISYSLLGEKINWEADYPDASMAREIRNDVAGHPTHRKNGKAQISHIYLVQHSLYKEHFLYMKNENQPNVQSNFVHVEVETICSNTIKCINDVLVKVLDMLDVELKEHKEKYRDQKMEGIFRELEYASEKILLRDDVFMDTAYKRTKKIVADCKDELQKRFGAWDTIESFAYKIEEIEKAYKLLDHELKELPNGIRLDIEDCLFQYLLDKLGELKRLSMEMDKEYES